MDDRDALRKAVDELIDRELDLAMVRHEMARIRQGRWWGIRRLIRVVTVGPRSRQALSAAFRQVVGRGNRVKDPLPDADTTKHAVQARYPEARVVVEQAAAALQIPAMRVPESQPSSQVRIAAVFDPFSEQAFAPEAHVRNLTRAAYEREFLEHEPDLLLIESAWRGPAGAWQRQIANENGPGDDLRALVALARQRDVPTVFWNKEDPPNYERFVNSARHFDQVLTTAEECLPDYERDLGHRRIGILPFAAQPRVHHPVGEPTAHRRGVVFAGTYYAEKHPDRREQMDLLLNAAVDHGLVIFSRIDGDPRYRFPDRFQPHVAGSLTYPQMLTAHQRYRIFLNVNSVSGSATMCSRRVFEVLAAGGAVISTPSQAISNLLGRHVHQVSDHEEATEVIRSVLADDEAFQAARLAALRHVHRHHTYRHRLEHILGTVGLTDAFAQPPSLTLVLAPGTPEDLERMQEMLRGQSRQPEELILVDQEIAPDGGTRVDGIAGHPMRTVERGPEAVASIEKAIETASSEHVAVWVGATRYGPHYLEDALAPFRMVPAVVSGQAIVRRQLGDALLQDAGDPVYRYAESLDPTTLVVHRGEYLKVGAGAFQAAADGSVYRRIRESGGRVVAVPPHEVLRVPGPRDRALGIDHPTAVLGETWNVGSASDDVEKGI